MAKDPVCGMEVNPQDAEHKTVYKGRIYYFCSPQCKKAFEENPDYYLEHGPAGMPGMHEKHHGHHHGHHGGHKTHDPGSGFC